MPLARRLTSTFALTAAIALGAAACGSSGSSGGTAANPGGGSTVSPSSGTSGGSASALCGGQKGSGNVTVGAFNFAESELLANIYATALKTCGYSTTVKTLGSREVVYPALKNGQLTVVPEYAATLTDFINSQNNGANAASKASGQITQTVSALRGELPTSLTALDPAPATDKNAFAVTQSFAKAHNLTTMSSLGAYSQQHPVVLGGAPECPQRPFCEPGLKKVYNLKISKFVSLDAGGPLTIKALTGGKIDVGEVFTSDPTVQANNLQVLTDDKNLQASDNIVPIVQKSAAKAPLTTALNAVDMKLTQDTLLALNKAVQVQRAPADQVAQQFLQQEGLTG